MGIKAPNNYNPEWEAMILRKLSDAFKVIENDIPLLVPTVCINSVNEKIELTRIYIDALRKYAEG
ncbi:hypothetical protein ABN224_03660 [Providencia rettgeri]